MKNNYPVENCEREVEGYTKNGIAEDLYLKILEEQGISAKRWQGGASDIAKTLPARCVPAGRRYLVRGGATAPLVSRRLGQIPFL